MLDVLVDLGLGQPIEEGLIEAMNKIDLLDPTTRHGLAQQNRRNFQSAALSAATGEGCDGLIELIDRRLESDSRVVRLDVRQANVQDRSLYPYFERQGPPSNDPYAGVALRWPV